MDQNQLKIAKMRFVYFYFMSGNLVFINYYRVINDYKLQKEEIFSFVRNLEGNNYLNPSFSLFLFNYLFPRFVGLISKLEIAKLSQFLFENKFFFILSLYFHGQIHRYMSIVLIMIYRCGPMGKIMLIVRYR